MSIMVLDQVSVLTHISLSASKRDGQLALGVPLNSLLRPSLLPNDVLEEL